jgi:hypothetical protein
VPTRIVFSGGEEKAVLSALRENLERFRALETTPDILEILFNSETPCGSMSQTSCGRKKQAPVACGRSSRVSIPCQLSLLGGGGGSVCGSDKWNQNSALR